jgi:hypothetical protein
MAWMMPAAIIGSSLLSNAQTRESAGRAADAQLEAARISAEAAKFKPYSITSGFGKSYFDTSGQTAGYELDPRLAAFRDQLYGLSSEQLGQLAGTTPEAEAQKYVTQQMGLLAPTRQAEDIAARQAALGSGRIGLGVSPGMLGGGSAAGVVNPDEFARQLARERINAQIAAEGTTYGQNIIDKLISRGTGLFSSGAGVEQLGMGTLTTGADIGKAGVQSGLGQAKALLQGGIGAAQANLAGGLSTANMLQRGGLALSGMFANNPGNSLQASFSNTGLGSSGFGTGLAYGNQDLGLFL